MAELESQIVDPDDATTPKIGSDRPRRPTPGPTDPARANGHRRSPSSHFVRVRRIQLTTGTYMKGYFLPSFQIHIHWARLNSAVAASTSSSFVLTSFCFSRACRRSIRASAFFG